MATVNNASAKITDYIQSLPQWSQALCSQLRQLILAADASITEEWKWGPHYGSNGMVCGYSAFQKHVKITFFNGSEMKDAKGLFNHCVDNEFSRSVKLLPGEAVDEKTLTEYIREAIAINAKGYKRVLKNKTVTVPDDLLQALQQNNAAHTFFEGLSYGYKKEFAEHVTTAKQEKTRQARIAKVVDHCANGKKLNDKYNR